MRVPQEWLLDADVVLTEWDVLLQLRTQHANA